MVDILTIKGPRPVTPGNQEQPHLAHGGYGVIGHECGSVVSQPHTVSQCDIVQSSGRVYLGEGITPVPAKLARKIRLGEYIDMGKLLPEF